MMNYRKNGWYYRDANRKSPSWTGVEFLYDFLISNEFEGSKGELVNADELEIGDIIQLSFNGVVFGHTLIVSNLKDGIIKVCAHSVDSKDRPLDTYLYEKIRCIKIY